LFNCLSAPKTVSFAAPAAATNAIIYSPYIIYETIGVIIDIKEKKLTLPLIYALQTTTWNKKRRIINIIKNHSHVSAKVQEVIEFVKQSGGIEYAIKVMQEFKDEALSLLSEFPDSEYKTSLSSLVSYTISREK